MSKHLTNQTVLVVPQVACTSTCTVETFREMKANGFEPFASALSDATHLNGELLCHVLAPRHDQLDGSLGGQSLLTYGIDEALVSHRDTLEACDEIVEELDIVWMRWQDWIAKSHTDAGGTQPQLESVVVQLLGGTEAVIGFGLEAAVALRTGVNTDWQKHGVNQLDRIGHLATDHGQSLLNHRFDLPKVGCLAHKERSIP